MGAAGLGAGGDDAVGEIGGDGALGHQVAHALVEILNCYFTPGDVGAFTVPEGALLH